MHSNNFLITFLTFSPLLVISQPRNSARHLNHRSPSPLNFPNHSHSNKLQKRYHKLSASLVQREYLGPEATIKCLTDFTWALCSDEIRSSCTDMGPVASGTKCQDNKMIWNGQGDLGTSIGEKVSLILLSRGNMDELTFKACY